MRLVDIADCVHFAAGCWLWAADGRGAVLPARFEAAEGDGSGVAVNGTHGLTGLVIRFGKVAVVGSTRK